MSAANICVVRVLLCLLAALMCTEVAFAGGIADEPCPNVRGEHTNTCVPGTVGAPYLVRFVETEGSGCGPGRQTFHFDSGTLPPGLSLAEDGLLSGVSTAAGTFRFYVEMREPQNDPANCAGKRTQKQFTVTVREKPWIVALPPPTRMAEVGVPLRIRLRARGGSGGFRWLSPTGSLPPGVRLSTRGWLEGTPRSAGVYGFVLVAADTEARLVRWSAKLSVAPSLALKGPTLPTAHVDRPYVGRISTVGGTSPRSWRLVNGRLPLGLVLETQAGRLAGTPRAPGRYVISIEVSDRLNARSTRRFVLRVRASASGSRPRPPCASTSDTPPSEVREDLRPPSLSCR